MQEKEQTCIICGNIVDIRQVEFPYEIRDGKPFERLVQPICSYCIHYIFKQVGVAMKLNPTIGQFMDELSSSNGNLSIGLMSSIREETLSSEYVVNIDSTENMTRLIFYSGDRPMFAIYLEKGKQKKNIYCPRCGHPRRGYNSTGQTKCSLCGFIMAELI